eukprot:COSAG01_NODE_2143_length_8317_cov_24.964103_4_plen_100_part_00
MSRLVRRLSGAQHVWRMQVRRDTAERKRQEAAFHQIRQEAALRQHLGAAYDKAGAERRRLAAEAQASSGDLCVVAEQPVRATATAFTLRRRNRLAQRLV